MTSAAKLQGFANDRDRLRSEHILELGIAQLDEQVIAECELDAVHAFGEVLPTSLDIRASHDHEAQRFILLRAPFRPHGRLAEIVARCERADPRADFELDRLLAGVRGRRGQCGAENDPEQASPMPKKPFSPVFREP